MYLRYFDSGIWFFVWEAKVDLFRHSIFTEIAIIFMSRYEDLLDIIFRFLFYFQSVTIDEQLNFIQTFPRIVPFVDANICQIILLESLAVCTLNQILS